MKGGKFLAVDRGAFNAEEPQDPKWENCKEAPPARFPLIEIARIDELTRFVLRQIFHQAC